MDTKSRPDPVALRLDELAAQVAYLVERQRKTEELLAEMTPIMREVMAAAIARLDEVERAGWFDDLRALGAAALEVRAALKGAEGVKPVGLMGAMRAARKPDVQKGLAVLMEVVGAVGRAAGAAGAAAAAGATDGRDAKADRRARLATILGPRRGRPIAALPPHVEAPSQTPRPPAITATREASPPPEIDPSAWTRAYAEQVAAAEGIALTAEHWNLIELARAEYLEKRVAANVRRLTQLAGCSTKDIYALFPKAPGRTIARIAGTPKPAGCL
jgi:tRNA 2-thiouridine synthesizing protein E